MNSPNQSDEAYQQHEKELQAREHALRLRELEAELHQQTPLPTTKHQPPLRSMQLWTKKAKNIALFVGIVVVTVVAIKIATQLAAGVMVLAIAWIAYKIFFERSGSKKG
ncbi:MAG: hypothetical protein RBJ76_04555 [Stenomitos frigidus ULC029]